MRAVFNFAGLVAGSRNSHILRSAYNDLEDLQEGKILGANGFTDHEVDTSTQLPDTFSEPYPQSNMNQHIPQYCGSCWAVAVANSINSRMARQHRNKGGEIRVSIQTLLNCSPAFDKGNGIGSCMGGNSESLFQALATGKILPDGIPYDDASPYLACTKDVTDDKDDLNMCPSLAKRGYLDCAKNIAYTCNTFHANGGFCSTIHPYPGVHITGVGVCRGKNAVECMRREILISGAIAGSIDASPLVNYTGGILHMSGNDYKLNHAITITGWGVHDNDWSEHRAPRMYWDVKNSWGWYWGEFGDFRVFPMYENPGGIEESGSFPKLGPFTGMYMSKKDQDAGHHLNGRLRNIGCNEDGSNCLSPKLVDHGHLVPPVQSKSQRGRSSSRRMEEEL